MRDVSAHGSSEAGVAGTGRVAVDLALVHLVAERGVVLESAAVLTPSERARAAAFRFDRDRTRCILARAHLRRLLAERLDRRPEAIELSYGAGGKPAIRRRAGDPDLRFNVSHSGDLAVIAITVGREIGVDVEAVRAMPDADAIAARYFSRREHEAYRGLAPADRPLAFFNCWTRKEAFVKALGHGLGYALESFDVTLTPGEPARILRVGEVGGDECGWSLTSFVPAPDFVAAVVVEE